MSSTLQQDIGDTREDDAEDGCVVYSLIMLSIGDMMEIDKGNIRFRGQGKKAYARPERCRRQPPERVQASEEAERE